MADRLTYSQLLDRLGLQSDDADSLGWQGVKDRIHQVDGCPLGDIVETIQGVASGLLFETSWFVRGTRTLVYLASDPTEGEFAIVDTQLTSFIAALEELRARTDRVPSPKMLKSLVHVDPSRRPKPVPPTLGDLASYSQLDVDLAKLAARANGDLRAGRITVEQIAKAVASALHPYSPGWGFGHSEVDMETGERKKLERVACVFAWGLGQFEDGDFVGSTVTVGVRQGSPDERGVATPNAAWEELGPWMDAPHLQTQRFKDWASTKADDRMKIPFNLAKAWAKDKLPQDRRIRD